jgi:hypothetical protein
MRLDLYRSLWGVSTPFPQLAPTLRASGYVGIETRLPAPAEQAEFRSLLRDHELNLIGILSTAGSTPLEHLDSLRRQSEELAAYGAVQITAQSGRDDWSLAESVDFYTRAAEWERSVSIPIAHELHRGRTFFHPWVTRDVLRDVPGIRLCIDYSHWVCVAERLLDAADPILALCAERALHIHTRVGYEEGPQVPDPSAPEYARHLAAHERWWKQAIDTQRSHGRTVLTATPEYGPPMYLHTHPHTNAPVAEIGQIVDWSARRFRELFGR